MLDRYLNFVTPYGARAFLWRRFHRAATSLLVHPSATLALLFYALLLKRVAGKPGAEHVLLARCRFMLRLHRATCAAQRRATVFITRGPTAISNHPAFLFGLSTPSALPALTEQLYLPTAPASVFCLSRGRKHQRQNPDEMSSFAMHRTKKNEFHLSQVLGGGQEERVQGVGRHGGHDGVRGAQLHLVRCSRCGTALARVRPRHMSHVFELHGVRR